MRPVVWADAPCDCGAGKRGHSCPRWCDGCGKAPAAHQVADEEYCDLCAAALCLLAQQAMGTMPRMVQP